MKIEYSIILVAVIGLTSCSNKLKQRISELEKENLELRQNIKKQHVSNSIFDKIDEAIKRGESQPVNSLENKLTRKEYEAKSMEEIKVNYGEDKYEELTQLFDKLDYHVEYLKTSFDVLVEKCGGRNDLGQLVDPRNKEWSDELLIKNGRSEEIRNMTILNAKLCKEFLLGVGYLEEEINLSLQIHEDHISKNKTWGEYYFSKMPVGALEPIFTKLKNDIYQVRVDVLEKLKEKMNP